MTAYRQSLIVMVRLGVIVVDKNEEWMWYFYYVIIWSIEG